MGERAVRTLRGGLANYWERTITLYGPRPTLPFAGMFWFHPSAAVVSAAISNAVYNAIGTRLRSVPFTADNVKAAIHG